MMRLLTLLTQAWLVGAVVYGLIRLVQAEFEERRWWKRQIESMQGKAAYKP